VRLAPGSTVAFGHGRTTQAGLDDFFAREVQLVSPILGSTIPLNLR